MGRGKISINKHIKNKYNMLNGVLISFIWVFLPTQRWVNRLDK